MIKKIFVTAVLGVLLSGCNALGESSLTRSIDSMTDQINKFADKAGSQTLFFNPSRIEAEGLFEDGLVKIEMREAQMLTKAQIDPGLRRLKNAAYLARQADDYAEMRRLKRAHKEIDRGLWTANDVLVFAVTNKSDTYELPMGKVNYLFINKSDGVKKKRFVASLPTLDFMNEYMYLVDTKSGDKIRYLSRNMEPIGPLETAYVAVIQTRLQGGQYQAVLNNMPVRFADKVSKAQRITFDITKN